MVSDENIARLRAYLELWNGRKLRPEERPWEQVFSHEPATALIGTDTVYVDNNLPDHTGEEYRGRDGIRRAAERWIEGFEWLLVELLEIIDADDRLVSVHRGRVKARHTGMEFEFPLAYVYTLREGQLIRCQSFADVGDALKAAGRKE